MSKFFEAFFLSWSWEVAKGLILAIFLAAAGVFGHWLVKIVHQAWRSRKNFGISGFWIGTCWLPSNKETHCIEIWQYAVGGDSVTLKFFGYNSASPKINKCLGGGVFRGAMLSAYHYDFEKSTCESGVIALELRGMRLVGVYVQFDVDVDNEQLFVSEPDYVQRRVKLPFLSRMRMIVGLPPFLTYKEAKEVYEKVSPTPAQPH